MDEATTERLCRWLEDALQAHTVGIDRIEPLAGGAIQENLSAQVRVDGGPRHGQHRWVLRRDAAATIAESHTRLNEHALLVAAYQAGVRVAEPIAVCSDPAVIGSPFSLMAFRPGVGYGPKLVKEPSLGGDREALVERLAQELATIHAIDPKRDSLAFIGPAPDNPVVHALQRLRSGLDALGIARPGLERALQIAALQPPEVREVTLVHGDFRTGNLLVDEHGLSAVLDWEFAGTGDPMSDIGWFCARCWRFSRPDLEAGGLGTRANFYRAYEAASGRRVNDAAVRWWELFAHLRWAVIALQQGARHESGDEPSLTLALTGRMADTLERDALRMAPHVLERRDVPPDAMVAPAALPAAHLLPATADALSALIGQLPPGAALTLRLAVRAIRVAERDMAGKADVDEACSDLLAVTGSDDVASLAHAIRTGDQAMSPAMDAALQACCDRIAASLQT